MTHEDQVSSVSRIRRWVVGRTLSPKDPSTVHRMALIPFFAWVGLGADGLSSSCYGPQEAFLALQAYPHLALFVALGSALTILVIGACYSQIIERFPAGGGGYVVASQLLSPRLGMVSGCALLIDYVLTITLSVASGADAVFSFVPAEWHRFRLPFALFGLVLLIVVNMRGVKESVMPLVPVFLVFLVTHLFVILYAVFLHAGDVGAVADATASDVRSCVGQAGWLGMLAILLRAYSMGAGTYTGIEAVSNGLPMLREPRAKTGKRTMVYMAVSLVIAVIGLMLAYTLCHVTKEDGKTLNASLFESLTSGWSGGFGHGFVLVTLISEAAILFVAAQTGFLGGPRVLANMALDRWTPNRFTLLSDRLVTQNGVTLMGGSAIVLMVFTKGSVEYLVVLYSITVFITFVLAQLGMVRHWWSSRAKAVHWKRGVFLNGFGLLMTGFILISVTIIKFEAGGWLTLLVMGVLVLVAMAVRKYYDYTIRLLSRLDTLVSAVIAESQAAPPGAVPDEGRGPADASAKTAVLLVNGFNGLGLHALFTITRLFGDTFKNYVFVQVGIVDAGNFKGITEVGRLEEHVQSGVRKYAAYMRHHGHHAEEFWAVGTDVVQETVQLASRIRARYPNIVFFAGQIVFKEETAVDRFLHNYIGPAIQRKLYNQGIPFVMLPIRV